MRKAFSSTVTSQVVLIRDALARAGIAATIQNENEAIAPVPAFQAPAELWITRDADYERASKIVDATMATMASRAELPSWACPKCGEANPATFDLCWNCETASPGDLSA